MLPFFQFDPTKRKKSMTSVTTTISHEFDGSGAKH